MLEDGRPETTFDLEVSENRPRLLRCANVGRWCSGLPLDSVARQMSLLGADVGAEERVLVRDGRTEFEEVGGVEWGKATPVVDVCRDGMHLYAVRYRVVKAGKGNRPKLLLTCLWCGRKSTSRTGASRYIWLGHNPKATISVTAGSAAQNA